MELHRVTRVVGTIAAIAGVWVILASYDTPNYYRGDFVGGLLVVSGLLLRIEAAISRTRQR